MHVVTLGAERMQGVQQQPKWLAERDTDFEDLRAALEWGARLDLKPEQRGALQKLCFKIAGEHMIPPFRLREVSERARAAENQVAELQAKIAALTAEPLLP
jgi:hypothetical protein